jgi:glycerol-3-phosphate O-acyltransferase
MPRNYILSGDNLQFFPLDTIGRRSGIMFIRRSFKNDEIYKLAVREYMRYLLASGANLEWYMEGGRSRTGKLRPPKYGLLRYIVDAISSDAVEDILLVPVSTTYDQLQEVGKMIDEETGITKKKEGLGWLTRYIRAQKKSRGKAYVRFGQPFSLREAISYGNHQPLQWTLDKIAFEVFQRINNVTPVTSPALVTIALLSVHDHALTLEEVYGVIKPLLKYAEQRNLPTTALNCLNSTQDIEEVLNTLIESGVVSRYESGLVPVFYIVPGKHSVAAFYRNSAIHWFVNRAIVEVGIMAASQERTSEAISHGIDKAFALRDLLKFEFIFSEKPAFEEDIKEEARLIDPNLHKLVPGRKVSITVLEKAPFLIAHRVLPAFLEAYFIVADQLAMHPSETTVDEQNFLLRCMMWSSKFVHPS